MKEVKKRLSTPAIALILIGISFFCSLIHIIAFRNTGLFVSAENIVTSQIFRNDFWSAMDIGLFALLLALLIMGGFITSRGKILRWSISIIGFLSLGISAAIVCQAALFSMDSGYALSSIWGGYAVVILKLFSLLLQLVFCILSVLLLRRQEDSHNES